VNALNLNVLQEVLQRFRCNGCVIADSDVDTAAKRDENVGDRPIEIERSRKVHTKRTASGRQCDVLLEEKLGTSEPTKHRCRRFKRGAELCWRNFVLRHDSSILPVAPSHGI